MARARPAPKTVPATEIPAQTLSPWAAQAVAQYNPEEDLKAIVVATLAGAFVYRNPMNLAPIAEFIEKNPEMRNEAGEIAIRANDAGIARVNGSVDPRSNGAVQTTANGSGGGENIPVGKIEIDTDVALIPATRGRNAMKRPDIYPFDALPLNGSFHIPVSGGDIKEQARKFSVTVSNANSRYKVETGETETVVVTDYQTGADGKLVKDANNKWIKVGEHQETRPVRNPTRTFQLRIVGADDKRGPGLRVFRTL